MACVLMRIPVDYTVRLFKNTYVFMKSPCALLHVVRADYSAESDETIIKGISLNLQQWSHFCELADHLSECCPQFSHTNLCWEEHANQEDSLTCPNCRPDGTSDSEESEDTESIDLEESDAETSDPEEKAKASEL